MLQAPEKPLTFEEFAALKGEGRYELVNGQLEELVPPKPRHGWTALQLSVQMGPYLKEHQPGSYAGVELDIPTLPFFGCRPDFAYYSPTDAARISLSEDRVLGVPTLVVEIVSEDDEARDTITKREEYARAGIQHYWILDPRRGTALTLVLSGDSYQLAGKFTRDDVLTSSLFPGLRLSLRPLFPE